MLITCSFVLIGKNLIAKFVYKSYNNGGQITLFIKCGLY